MDIELRKWGNSLGLRIPHPIAKSFDLDDNSIVELIECQDSLILKKKKNSLTLDELLASIPNDFEYPDDIADFVDSKPLGKELI
jgi:antitoxin MazE